MQHMTSVIEIRPSFETKVRLITGPCNRCAVRVVGEGPQRFISSVIAKIALARRCANSYRGQVEVQE